MSKILNHLEYELEYSIIYSNIYIYILVAFVSKIRISIMYVCNCVLLMCIHFVTFLSAPIAIFFWSHHLQKIKSEVMQTEHRGWLASWLAGWSQNMNRAALCPRVRTGYYT